MSWNAWWPCRRRIGAIALGGAMAMAGCIGAIGDGGTGAGDAPPLPPDSEPSESPLMKLSTEQYRNTVTDLLAATGLTPMLPTIEPFLASIPADGTDTFSTLDDRIASEHFNAYWNVAIGIGDAIEADAVLREALAGACATEGDLTDGCVDDFLRSFGRLVFRRPLTDAERARYAELNDGERSPAEAIRAMVVTLLVSPQFVNHVEVDGPSFQGRDDILQLTPYELASRLSYTLWRTMPDEALFAAAEDGTLGTDEGFAAQVDRLFDDPRARDTIWQFYNEWFRLDRFAGFQTNRPGFQTLAEGENVGEEGYDHYGDMVREVRDLVALVVWENEGTLDELLTTNVSVTDSEALARLYGVAPYDGEGDPPRFPEGERAGILQRAALLANPLEQTNPFHRGAVVRRYVLCDSLPAPDPNALPPGSLDAPPIDAEATTRERFDAKVVGNNLCEGCHARFSDIGYVLEAYDALGRYRTIERVIDEENGDVIAELPIDVDAPARIEAGDSSLVSGPAELNERIVASGKVADCISEQYFSYALRRKPGRETGDRNLEDQMAEATGASLLEAFKTLVLHPSFKARKVGAP